MNLYFYFRCNTTWIFTISCITELYTTNKKNKCFNHFVFNLLKILKIGNTKMVIKRKFEIAFSNYNLWTQKNTFYLFLWLITIQCKPPICISNQKVHYTYMLPFISTIILVAWFGSFCTINEETSENDMHETDHFDEIKRNKDKNTDT